MQVEDFEVEKLIELVKEKEILWNLCHPLYKNIKKKAQQWKMIGIQLGLPGEIAKMKWKYLRDSYSRVLNKKKISGQGAEDPESCWKYSDIMEFLKIHLKPRSTVSNYLSSSANEDVYAASTSAVTHATPTNIFKNFITTSCGESPDLGTSFSDNIIEEEVDYDDPGASDDFESPIGRNSVASTTPVASRNRKSKSTTGVEQTLLLTMQSVQEYINKPRPCVCTTSSIASSSTTTNNMEDEFYCRSLMEKLSTFPIELRNEAKIEMMKYLSALQSTQLTQTK